MKKIIQGLLLVVIFTVFAGYLFLNTKIPQREGEIQLSGLEKSVTVNYDRYGIPHIYAESDKDLYQALGYVHAQDRLFQMELMRRLGSGRMAEVFGEELLAVDKVYRTLGLRQHAKAWLVNIEKTADPDLLDIMDNYLKGINNFQKQGAIPIEYTILGIPVEPYTREDIVTIMGFVSFSFAQGMHDDPFLQILSQTLDPKYLDDLGILYTKGFPQLPVNSIAPELLSSISSQILSVNHQLQFANLFHGSNSWLIAPQKSVSGKAILVNDPHIAYGQPSVWYEAQLKSDRTDIYGHFMGLIPLPLLGHNRDLAWGLTMFENDDMDFYLEKTNPENPNQYWAIDHWQDFQIQQYQIKVKGKEAVDFVVKKSRHGPVINPILFQESQTQNHFEQPIAMWWSFLDINNRQMEAFYELPFADTLEKASAAAAKIHAPGLNLMYANANGDIAWWATAKLPIRPSHVNSKFILDGASGKDDILGFYDFSHNPKNINPQSGTIYTSNNQPADMGDGLIPGYYAPKDRPTRITQMLAEKQQYSVDDMKRMLLDNTTPTALLFKQIAIPVLSENREHFSVLEKQALKLLDAWKGNHDAEEVAATIYMRFRLKLMQLAMEDEMGSELYNGFQNGFLMDRSIWRILPKPTSVWWDNIHTPKLETRDSLIVEAFLKTISFLESRFGDKIEGWQWRQDVKMVHRHPLGQVKILESFFNVGPLATNAGVEAVNNIMFASEGDDLKVLMGQSTRRIIDFGDIDHTLGISPTGQSGVFNDKHYADQAEAYSRGEFRPQYYSKPDVTANSESVLILNPE